MTVDEAAAATALGSGRLVLLSGGSGPLAAGLREALAAQLLTVPLDGTDPQTAAALIACDSHEWPDPVVWVHAAPAPSQADDAMTPAALEVTALEAALDLAEAVAVSAARRLVFMYLMPAPGLYRSPHDRVGTVAAAAAESLARTKVPDWSVQGWRIATIVYGPHDGLEAAGWNSKDQLLRRIPMGRYGTLSELAGVMTFVASDAAAYLTGSTIRADGGWNAYSWIYPYRTI
jgi:citronellol/citronellal dehydrogenase